MRGRVPLVASFRWLLRSASCFVPSAPSSAGPFFGRMPFQAAFRSGRLSVPAAFTSITGLWGSRPRLCENSNSENLRRTVSLEIHSRRPALKRCARNLNRGIPAGGFSCFPSFGRMDHVSTIAIGASCSVSTLHRGGSERTSGSGAPEAVAGDGGAMGAFGSDHRRCALEQSLSAMPAGEHCSVPDHARLSFHTASAHFGHEPFRSRALSIQAPLPVQGTILRGLYILRGPFVRGPQQ